MSQEVSKWLGSVDYNPNESPTYKYRWNNPLIRSPLILTSVPGHPSKGQPETRFKKMKQLGRDVWYMKSMFCFLEKKNIPSFFLRKKKAKNNLKHRGSNSVLGIDAQVIAGSLAQGPPMGEATGEGMEEYPSEETRPIIARMRLKHRTQTSLLEVTFHSKERESIYSKHIWL